MIVVLVAASTVANHATTHAFQTALHTHTRSQRKWTTSYSSSSSSSSLPLPPTRLNIAAAKISLKDYLQSEIDSGTIDADLFDVVVALAKSCAEVSMRLQTLSLGLQYHHDASSDDAEADAVDTNVTAAVAEIETKVNVQGEQQKGMDVVANDIFIANLQSVDAVLAMASEEEDSVILNHRHKHRNSSSDSNTAVGGGCYEIAFDPLDGSGNLDANLPTGSIFGIAPYHDSNGDGNSETTAFFSRPGSALRAAGYALYSSSTELVVCFGKDHPGGVLGFTLDPTKYHQHEIMDIGPRTAAEDAFVLSRANIACPPSGPYYSLNEAREPDWPDGLKRWVSDAKTKRPLPYSARYVCSLCADFHRTLLQGGWAGNPRPHLRLLYEAAPLAFVVEAAGGRGSDGVRELLEIVPKGLHDRVPVFLGSRGEICDLVETYGDVQQVEAKRYEA